jgi:hypothetical protein
MARKTYPNLELPCPCTLCADSACAHPNTKARLNTPTLTRDNSTIMAPIDDAIADLESRDPGEQHSLSEVAREWGVVRSTLTRR